MKKVLYTASTLALAASGALAGGIDRSGQSVGVIFEEGNYAEISFGSVNPNVSGSAVAVLGGVPSGDMAASYSQLGGALKYSVNENLDVALIFDQPFGADVSYPAAAAPYYAAGSVAELNTSALTGVVKYTLPSMISIYGGLRYQTMSADASIPFVAGYTGSADRDGSLGYLVGIAWEKPEIAARVALTYNSKIKHDLATTETSLLGALASTTTVETPESVNFEFQTGVAQDTLLFGSVRWVDWSNFDISPAQYGALTGGGSLVSYDNDSVSYSLGIGRRLNENWSAAVTLGYEKSAGGIASNLGPTDGYASIGLGATYTKDNVKVTAGVRYVDIGDAQTELGAVSPSANFTGNKAVGFGVKVGISF